MKVRILILSGALAFGLAACSSDDSSEPESGATASPAAAVTTSAMTGSENFGPGCAAVPASGAGSFSSMAAEPVATAAAGNPLLSTLVTAVKEAGLVDTLNSAKDITVFAPSNDAFAKVPADDLKALLADKKKLTEVLTYHVVPGRKAPADLTDGNFKTLQGDMLTTKGSGMEYTVGADDAKVVCGNVQTSNATVYIIDSVLMPPKS